MQSEISPCVICVKFPVCAQLAAASYKDMHRPCVYGVWLCCVNDLFLIFFHSLVFDFESQNLRIVEIYSQVETFSTPADTSSPRKANLHIFVPTCLFPLTLYAVMLLLRFD